MPVRLELESLPGRYAVCRVDPVAAIPAWATGPFVSLTRTAEELSVVCSEDNVPPDVRAERGWRCLRVAGTLDFSLVGVLAGLVGPLATAGVSVFAVSTFDTDHLLVKDQDLRRAVDVLRNAGHAVRV